MQSLPESNASLPFGSVFVLPSTLTDWQCTHTRTQNGGAGERRAPCQRDRSWGEREQLSRQLEQMYSFTLIYSNYIQINL